MAKPVTRKAKEPAISGNQLLDSIAKSLSRDGSGKLENKDLAKRLGQTLPTIVNWRARSFMKPSIVANMVAKAIRAAKVQAERDALDPIVEFYPLDPAKVGEDYEMFRATPDASASPHPYRAGLKAALEKKRGVYVFYDSRGCALYVGKTAAQTLWKEMNFALNRPRAKQTIRRVIHPTNRVAFDATAETRQIRSVEVELHELARYISAYEVSQPLIGELESLLIRAFANDLSNVKMERFGGGPQDSDKGKKTTA